MSGDSHINLSGSPVFAPFDSTAQPPAYSEALQQPLQPTLSTAAPIQPGPYSAAQTLQPQYSQFQPQYSQFQQRPVQQNVSYAMSPGTLSQGIMSPGSMSQGIAPPIYPQLGHEPGFLRCPHCDTFGVTKTRNSTDDGLLCYSRKLTNFFRLWGFICAGGLCLLNPLMGCGCCGMMTCCTYVIPTKQCCCAGNLATEHRCRNCSRLIARIPADLQ
jgi:hypothetical protein